MKPGTRITTIIDDCFSALPMLDGFSNFYIDDIHSREVIEIYLDLEQDWDGEIYHINTKKSWSVSKGAVALSFENHIKKIFEIAKTFSDKLIVYTSGLKNMPQEKGVFIYPQEDADEETVAYFTRKTNRLLLRAIHLADKQANPTGTLIFNRKYWNERTRKFLINLTDRPDFPIAWVAPDFIPAFSVALKEMRNSKYGPLKTKVIGFWVNHPSEIRDKLLDIDEFLNLPEDDDQLEYRKSVAGFLDSLHRGDSFREGLEITALFIHKTVLNRFQCICLGFATPEPKNGYQITLSDGETAFLPIPPWLMGKTVK